MNSDRIIENKEKVLINTGFLITLACVSFKERNFFLFEKYPQTQPHQDPSKLLKKDDTFQALEEIRGNGPQSRENSITRNQPLDDPDLGISSRNFKAAIINIFKGFKGRNGSKEQIDQESQKRKRNNKKNQVEIKN